MTMLENPMVIGEYYDDDSPDWVCPHCHTEWYEGSFGWESESKYIHREPMHMDGCYLCELEKRTAKDAVAYAKHSQSVALFDLLERIMDDYGLTAELAGDPHPMLDLLIAADPDLVEQRAEEWAEEQDDDYYDWYLGNQ